MRKPAIFLFALICIKPDINLVFSFAVLPLKETCFSVGYYMRTSFKLQEKPIYILYSKGQWISKFSYLFPLLEYHRAENISFGIYCFTFYMLTYQKYLNNSADIPKIPGDLLFSIDFETMLSSHTSTLSPITVF